VLGDDDGLGVVHLDVFLVQLGQALLVAAYLDALLKILVVT